MWDVGCGMWDVGCDVYVQVHVFHLGTRSFPSTIVVMKLSEYLATGRLQRQGWSIELLQTSS